MLPSSYESFVKKSCSRRFLNFVYVLTRAITFLELYKNSNALSVLLQLHFEFFTRESGGLKALKCSEYLKIIEALQRIP